MSLCSRCGRRKAKRDCPALGSSLCSLCCGLIHNRDIHCPESCPHLVQNRPYQERRAQERSERAPLSPRPKDDILRDERLAWLAAHIEFPLKVFGERDQGLNDGQVSLALEYARDKLAGAGRVLILPGESLKPRNDLGEAILENMDKCRQESVLILPGTDSDYSQEERLKVLDRVLASARETARGGPEARNYIDHLIRHFARIEERSRGENSKPSA
jgi:hypothetical protein